MFDCDEELNDVIDGQPRLNGLPEEHERHECECIGYEIIDRISARGSSKRESLLRMMHAVKSPKKSTGMLPAMNPIGEEIRTYEIDGLSYRPGHRME